MKTELMAIIYNILMKMIHLQCTLFLFRHSHGKNFTPCRLFLSYYFFHTRDISTLFWTEMSRIFVSLIIRMVCNHQILLVHFMNIINYSVVRVISAASFDNTACAFVKFPERDGNWTEYILIRTFETIQPASSLETFYWKGPISW